MNLDTRAGRILTGTAFAIIGLEALLTGHLPDGLTLKIALPSVLAGLLGTGFAAAVIVSAVAPGFRRAPLIAAAFPALCMLLLHFPRLITQYRDPLLWSSMLQMVAITSGCLLLSDQGRTMRIGRLVLVAALVGFGAQHFMYPAFIASLIPAWMPARTPLAWLTGAGFVAAAISFTLQRYQELAGRLLGLMFFSWVALLHIPLIIGNSGFEPQWTSGLIALGFCGVALLVAGETEPLPAALRGGPMRLAVTAQAIAPNRGC